MQNKLKTSIQVSLSDIRFTYLCRLQNKADFLFGKTVSVMRERDSKSSVALTVASSPDRTPGFLLRSRCSSELE